MFPDFHSWCACICSPTPSHTHCICSSHAYFQTYRSHLLLDPQIPTACGRHCHTLNPAQDGASPLWSIAVSASMHLPEEISACTLLFRSREPFILCFLPLSESRSLQDRSVGFCSRHLCSSQLQLELSPDFNSPGKPTVHHAHLHSGYQDTGRMKSDFNQNITRWNLVQLQIKSLFPYET